MQVRSVSGSLLKCQAFPQRLIGPVAQLATSFMLLEDSQKKHTRRTAGQNAIRKCSHIIGAGTFGCGAQDIYTACPQLSETLVRITTLADRHTHGNEYGLARSPAAGCDKDILSVGSAEDHCKEDICSFEISATQYQNVVSGEHMSGSAVMPVQCQCNTRKDRVLAPSHWLYSAADWFSLPVPAMPK